MPKIRIFETDSTGITPSDVAIVFVPGNADLKENVADANGCVYIPSTYSSKVGTENDKYFTKTLDEIQKEYVDGSDINVIHLIKLLTSQGYGVIYKKVEGVTTSAYSEVTFKDSHAFEEASLFILNSDKTHQIATTYNKSTTYYRVTYASADAEAAPECVKVGKLTEAEFKARSLYADNKGEAIATIFGSASTKYYKLKSGLDASQFSFLKNKNEYNIKFITTGTYGTVPVTKSSSSFSFDFTTLNALNQITGCRKDCVVLADLAYSNLGLALKDGDSLAKAYSTTLAGSSFIQNIVDVHGSTVNVGSRAATLMPNALMSSDTGKSLSVPASLVYLFAFASSSSKNAKWAPTAGVNRGIINPVFTPDLSLSKYVLDEDIIKDDAGVSFNGITYIRPYGYTIWGDRTLLLQGSKGVQATSYLSLRNLVSDVVKVAYDSAIKNTYETNNDITWMNFKVDVVKLLDSIVSSGVLQSYKLKRRATEERNKMIAVITLYPNLPVENFDIYVDLENAEVTVAEEE